MPYRRVKTLDHVDAAYIAGFFDGEGTVTLSRRNRYKQRGLALTISNTERVLLEHVQKTVGTGTITNKRIAKPGHTPSYAYHLWNRQALALLEQIEPFLRSYKATRAALVLREYVRLTPRNGRYTQEQLRARDTFIEQFFTIQPGGESRTPRIRLDSNWRPQQ